MHRHLQYAGTLICYKHSKNCHTFFPQRAKPIIKQGTISKGNEAQVDFWDLVIYFISENVRRILSYQFRAVAILWPMNCDVTNELIKTTEHVQIKLA